MEIPKDICVDPFDITLNQEISYPDVSCSSLFRTSAHITESVPFAIEQYRQQGDRVFHALCLGVSYGAELDSIAAILNRNAITGGYLMGVDENPDVIAAAEQGAYCWGCDCRENLSTEEVSQVVSAMQSVGFKTAARGNKQTILDARGVRTPHEIVFDAFGIHEIGGVVSEINLITCNNTLPYAIYGNEENIAVACLNIADSMRQGSVLSIACMDEFFESEEYTYYAHWHDGLETALGALGLQPVIRNSHNKGLVFQKAV